jgi:hypothetical protein
MTVETLRADIDWHYLRNVQMLHWVRVLVNYVPGLNILSSEISARFCSPPIAKHRMCEGRKTVVQPCRNKFELYWMQPIRPCWYEGLRDGIDRF